MSMTARSSADFGMVGLGVMGENLALNIEEKGYSVAVWDRKWESTARFLTGEAKGRRMLGARSPEELIRLIPRPRRIMMMVKAGDPVDWTIRQLLPYLEEGDILIDGGNSHFQETRRREEELRSRDLRYCGTGVSGGESGARRGPSLMPGGEPETYQALRPVFEKIAAQVADGACVTHCGPDGAGHFVKMVHNGIEYGDMQLIAEAYQILSDVAGLDSSELEKVFREWNRGVLDSYLIEITSKIFSVRDPETDRVLVELVLDRAGQKGTGKWTAQAALDLGVAVPSIHAAIDSRFLSALKAERVRASRTLSGPPAEIHPGDREAFVREVHDALYASKICCYAQGFALLRAASDHYGWRFDLSELARIWKGGCIIRARLLDEIQRACQRNPGLENLLMDVQVQSQLKAIQPNWRRIVELAQARGLPVMAMSASLAYFDAYRAERLPHNLTQAQRDYFGAHGYERADRPGEGSIHTDWSRLASRESQE